MATTITVIFLALMFIRHEIKIKILKEIINLQFEALEKSSELHNMTTKRVDKLSDSTINIAKVIEKIIDKPNK